ncbi:MAG: cysteine--tRNA ligase [Simkaniaceae bacterium]
MPDLKLFNTETRQKEVFVSKEKKCVKLYTCGPTIYDYAHIGNFRTYIFEDLLRRTLKYFGFSVYQVMNLTDVDDKTIQGAVTNQVSLESYTKPFKEAFFSDFKRLQIEPAEKYPAATEHIAEMIEMIEILLKKGFAYRGQDGGVYFSIQKCPRYGRLSHLKLDELKTNALNRTFSDEYEKDQASDFVLWKAYDETRDGSVFWESPFGKGRPGWHIECSAMALKHLGSEIDIHCGGVDNLFPHHENEIAQSECATDQLFVRYWLHSEHLLVNNQKMSKSKGNFYTLRDLLEKGYTGREVRYLLLATHYKTQLNFTLEGLVAARSSLKRIDDFILRLQDVEDFHSSHEALALIQKVKNHFKEALADDLNISLAIAALFDFLREINTLIDQKSLSKQEAKHVIETLKEFNQVLEIMEFQREEVMIPEDVQKALLIREKARSEKNWAEADIQRDYIFQKGYRIIDTPSGARVTKK